MQKWEIELMKRVSSEKGWQLVEAFAKQMRCLPDEVQRGAKILVKSLADCGIKAVVHTPEIYLGIPLSASVSANDNSMKGKASALSPAVKALKAPLLYLAAKPFAQGVHPGNASELFEQQFDSEADARASVSGHIVLTQGLSNPARTQLLQSWGALGVIVINPGDRSHWGTNSVVWGSPIGEDMAHLPKIASVAVSRVQGDELLKLADKGETVTLNVEALHGWFKQPVVTAEILGAGPEAKDFVLLHSHYDSWEYGVGDNATGNAVLLEVARLFAQNPQPFRRSVRFAWWPGHSAGRYAGSSWYADAYGTDLTRHCIAHVNCDSPGCKDATSYASVRSMIEAAPLLAQSVKDLFGQECKVTRPGRAGDYSFNNLGVTGTLLTSSMIPLEERKRRGWYAVGGCGGSPAWHSEYDTLEVADRGVIENDTRLYALVVARLANAEMLPLDYRAALAEIQGHVQTLTSGHLADVQLKALMQRFEQAVNTLDRCYVSAKDAPQLFNSTLLRLSRILVRMNYAIGPAWQQDPARSLNPVPVMADSFHRSEANDPMQKIARLRALNAIDQYLDDLLRVTS